MQKNPASQFGFFNPRILFAFALGGIGVFLAMFSFARTAPNEVIGSDANPPAASVLTGKGMQNLRAPSSSERSRLAKSELSARRPQDKIPALRPVGIKGTPVSTPLAAAGGAGAWTIAPSPNVDAGDSLNILSGGTCVSSSDCWAVGYHQAGLYYQTLTERWDGTVWSIVPSPNTSDAQHNVLSGIACVSGSDCWAVGYWVGSANQTLIEHWNGTSWTIVSSPDTSTSQNNLLSSVTCASASDCWAVGYSAATGSGPSQTLVERWNGTFWTIVASPNVLAAQASVLKSVACASTSECWAVGSSAAGITTQTLIERWDGTAWAIVSSPNTASDSDYFNGVACASASECWAVGYSTAGGGHIARWDGNLWSSVSSNSNAVQFSSVTCLPGANCWAVGYSYSGAAQTLVVRWNGTSWATIASPNVSTTQSQFLNNVTCSSGADCWSVGYSFGAYFQTLIEHWDGIAWTISPSANALSKQYNQLFGMTCLSASECWAVGGYGGFTGGRNYLSLIQRWDGNSWTNVSSPNTSPMQTNVLNSVSCISASDCWSVGYHDLGLGGSTYIVQTLSAHWNGSSWSLVATPSVGQNDLLLGVTCTSASNCWAVGYSKNASGRATTLIENWDGTSWNVVSSPNASPTASNNLFEVKCPSASECWAVGASGERGVNGTFVGGTGNPLVEHWNGSAWTLVSAPTPTAAQSAFFIGLSCVSTSDCWAVGSYSDTGRYYQTLIEHWDGSSWLIVPSPSTLGPQDNYLNAAACASTSECWAVGYTGGVGAAQTLIERWDGTSWTIVNSPNVTGASENNLHGVACIGDSDCWAVGVDRGSNGVAQTLFEHYTTGLGPIPTSVVSRKAHGSGGTFDVDLPLTGPPAIECRSGGDNGDHQIVLTFPNPVTVAGDSVTSSDNQATADPPLVNNATVTINLHHVSNAQTINVTLAGVNDGTNNGNVSIPMGVLLGDTTADGFVNSGDIAQTKSQSGVALTNANFREDVNTDGAINSGDIALVKSKSGTAVP